MNKGKKIILATTLIVIIIVILIVFLSPSGYEKRFKDILDEYDDNYTERLKNYEDESVLRCYDLGDSIGFIAISKGYEEEIVIFAEFSLEKLDDVRILYQNESQDHGDLVTEEWFLKRLNLPYDKELKIVRNKKENANEVIAITGATITSDAVVEAINECAKTMEEIKSEEY